MIVGPHPACDSLLHLSQIVPLILALPFMPNRFVESLDKGVMSRLMDEEIKRWTARRKTALVLDIIQGKTTMAEASRAYDLAPSEVESWVEDGKKGMENALKANPLDIHSQYDLPDQGLAGPQTCRRMSAGPPTCAASGPARTSGAHWQSSSTATAGNCWAGSSRAAPGPKRPRLRWSMP